MSYRDVRNKRFQVKGKWLLLTGGLLLVLMLAVCSR